jgi:hypothetical protein
MAASPRHLGKHATLHRQVGENDRNAFFGVVFEEGFDGDIASIDRVDFEGSNPPRYTIVLCEAQMSIVKQTQHSTFHGRRPVE